MDRTKILQGFLKQEDKLLVSKLLDKVEYCKTRRKIVYTDFLDLYQRNIIEKVLKNVECNYSIFGGYDNANRVVVIIYPDEKTEEMIQKNYGDYIKLLRIELPNSLREKYHHKDYLSGIMKLGVKREKFGDIIVSEDGADIVVCKEIAQYLEQSLKQLTRFKKAKINLMEISNIKMVDIKKEELRIVIQSLRLDCVIAQLANTSRTKAKEIIEEGRVFINYENELKSDKYIKEKDIIVIRGKGKFEIYSLTGNTKKNKQIISVNKYI